MSHEIRVFEAADGTYYLDHADAVQGIGATARTLREAAKHASRAQAARFAPFVLFRDNEKLGTFVFERREAKKQSRRKRRKK
jgi:hypothetical protein